MKPRWLGPYIIEEDLGKGVFRISNQKTGVVLKKCVNQCRLKLFHTASQPEPASSQPTSLEPANLDSPATSQPLLGSTPTNLPPNAKTDSNSSQPTSLEPANLESPHSPATSQPLLTSTPIKSQTPILMTLMSPSHHFHHPLLSCSLAPMKNRLLPSPKHGSVEIPQPTLGMLNGGKYW